MSLYYNKELVDGVEELPRLTQAEFNNLPLEQKPKIWIKRNATETDRGITGSDVEYDNSASELQATDVQAAIDELEENIEKIPTDASELPYSSTQSTKQKIDEVDSGLNAKPNIDIYTLAGNSSIRLSHAQFVLLMTDRGGMWTEGDSNRTLDEIKSSQSITVTRIDNYTLRIQSNIQYGTRIVAYGVGDTHFIADT